jgi:hypothetical protein
MGQNEVLALAKELNLTDERELFAKVIVSYSTLSKVTALAFGAMTGAGSDGFVGIYKNQLVCFDANTLGTKPTKERFRFSFDVIESHEIKIGIFGLNNQFLIKAGAYIFKLYFTGKRKEMIEKINASIQNKKTE